MKHIFLGKRLNTIYKANEGINPFDYSICNPYIETVIKKSEPEPFYIVNDLELEIKENEYYEINEEMVTILKIVRSITEPKITYYTDYIIDKTYDDESHKKAVTELVSIKSSQDRLWNKIKRHF